MKTKVIRIGNSRGVRLPATVLEAYGIREGDELELDRRREGILLTVGRRPAVIGYEESYLQMEAEAAERAEWSAWDAVAGDGVDG